MKPKFYDASPVISPRLGVFPGDQPFERLKSLGFKSGDHLELSSIKTTVHLGAHADAPSHYHPDGLGINAVSVTRYIGKAQVIRVPNLKPKSLVEPKDIKVKIEAPRVLIDTMSFKDPEKWNSDFCAFSPELLDFLADHGVRLVGIDTPSVDVEDSKTLPAHAVLRRRELSVLEGLLLSKVPEGLYTLISPPLPIEDGDASPVRALLYPYPFLELE